VRAAVGGVGWRAAPARGAARGAPARAHVRDRFSLRRLEDDLASLYRELLGTGVPL
jgi:hypothetical protein